MSFFYLAKCLDLFLPSGLFCLSEIPPFCVECLLAVVSPENLTPAGAAATLPWNTISGAGA